MSNTIAASSDPYTSRMSDQWEMADRVDPIVSRTAAGPLSSAQLSAYETNGFLFLPELYTDVEVRQILKEAATLAKEWPRNRPGLVREPGSDVVRSIFRLHRFNAICRQFLTDERMTAVVRQIVGTDVYIHQSRINYKPAFDGKEFFWHSDFETWHIEDGMPRMRALSASILLTESTEFNGPLMLIPGSHTSYVRCAGATPENHYEQSLRRQEYGVPSREALEQLVERGGIVAPKGLPGSVILFDCNTMHGSGGNLSPLPRINLFAVYNSVDNQLTDPFCEHPPRPDYLAERDFNASDKR